MGCARDTQSTLALFLGWRIWKMRNRLLFENNRDHIVQVIKAAMMDMNLWKEALLQNEPATPAASSAQPQFITDILPQETCLYCVADASWKSPTEKT